MLPTPTPSWQDLPRPASFSLTLSTTPSLLQTWCVAASFAPHRCSSLNSFGSEPSIISNVRFNLLTKPCWSQGDSGFIVIRNEQVVIKSKALQHYFDCPLQFGAFPEFVEATDTADMADFYNVPLLPGDIVIAGAMQHMLL